MLASSTSLGRGFALLLVGLLGACYWIAEFPDESPANQPDADADGDADADSDGDADADHDDGDDADPDSEADADEARQSWPCSTESFSRPQVRVTALSLVAPDHVYRELFQPYINISIDNFDVVLLMEVDFVARTMKLGLGEAVAEVSTEDGFCSLRWSASSQTEYAISMAGASFSTTEVIDTLALSGLLGELEVSLPLQHVTLQDVSFDETRTFVGEPLMECLASELPLECASSWATDGLLIGWVSFEDAQEISIEGLSTDLCELLCGAHCSGGSAGCPTPPAIIPESGGVEGYEFQMELGAGAVSIE